MDGDGIVGYVEWYSFVTENACDSDNFNQNTRHKLFLISQVFSGLLDEAAGLLKSGISTGSNNASRAVGYRQAMAMLQVCPPTGSEQQTNKKYLL